MRIAFISYEYPPDTAHGGIGTYTWQAAQLLAQRGHSVEVFAASPKRSGSFEEGHARLNLIDEMRRDRFSQAVVNAFAERHAQRNFDIVESPECGAEGYHIGKLYSHLPHVVKLHTPSVLLDHLGRSVPRFSEWARHNCIRARMALGALRRLQRPSYQPYMPVSSNLSCFYELERSLVLNCDLVVAPSQSMLDWAIANWSIDPLRAMVVPNPYVPSEELCRLPVGGAGNIVGFFGRLEERKGISYLIKAIPHILRAEPRARFRFVGRPTVYPGTGERFDVYLMRQLRKCRDSIEIVGLVPLAQMPPQYGAVDICVLPSIWENFPNVCLEAMSAGRAIVAGNAGGMTEMLENGKHGILVAPRDYKEIVNAVVRLLRSTDLRLAIGKTARQRVLSAYSLEKIGPQIELSYSLAIEHNRRHRH